MRKIFVIHHFIKGFISRLCKGPGKINKKKNPVRKSNSLEEAIHKMVIHMASKLKGLNFVTHHGYAI